VADNLTTVVSSSTQTVEINRGRPMVIIGERINPTGRKKVLAALQEGNVDTCAKLPTISEVRL